MNIHKEGVAILGADIADQSCRLDESIGRAVWGLTIGDVEYNWWKTLFPPIIFPTISEIPLATRYAHLLMDMSSVMPESLHPYVKDCRANFANPPYIAMSYNASMSELVAMLNIGSRSIKVGL